MRKAVVDVGSNSVLLTVEEFVGGRWTPVFESSEVTGLGEGVKQTGSLGAEPMRRTLAAVARAFDRARGLGVENVVAGATMAARIAGNADTLLAEAQAQGTPIFVVSGDEEARLGFLSVAEDPTFGSAKRLSIVDPGGQSTELATAARQSAAWREEFRRSFPLGTLALRGAALADERCAPDRLLQASFEIDETLAAGGAFPAPGTVVTLGATGTNLVSIRDGLADWNPERVHGQFLGFEEISKSVARLAPMSDAERAAVVGIEPGREGTIHIGALILERFLFAIGAEGCFVSVRGWRHAMLESDSSA